MTMGMPRAAALALVLFPASVDGSLVAARSWDIVHADTAMADTALAFPGAEGWARHTPGGRGGAILRVTTLAPTGPGSFTEAVAAKGPRIVVFEVGGAIDMDGATVKVREPYLTIAGQTAPSPGITFVRGGFEVATHDVVIRHVRVRPGTAGHAAGSGWEVDGITTTTGAHDVIVDHCSISWATDENLSASGPRFDGADLQAWRESTSHRVTFSNNIVAQALSHATHSKGEHSKGSLVHDNVTGVLVLRSLYAANVQRNPLFKGGASGAVVNNVIFDPGTSAVDYHLDSEQWEGHPHAVGRLALVGNVMRHGADTRPRLPLLKYASQGDLELYEHDNRAFDATGAPATVVGVSSRENGGTIHPVAADVALPPGLRPVSSDGTWEAVLAGAGARPWDRDAVDQAIVRGVRDRSLRAIDSEAQAGGYPAPAPTRAPFVADEWDLRTMERRVASRR
jgi:pectate lyase